MPITQRFTVQVDDAIGLDEAIKKANFDYVNSGISQDHFPVAKKGQATREIVLFAYDDFINTEDIIEDIIRNGYQPATIQELVAFATQYPDVQKKGAPIVALGSIWERGPKEHVVPVLRGGDNDRNMHLLRTANKWTPSERFAAAKPSST